MEALRIIQSRKTRNNQVTRVRNDLATQRGERIDALYSVVRQRLIESSAADAKLKEDVASFEAKLTIWRDLQRRIEKCQSAMPGFRDVGPLAWRRVRSIRKYAKHQIGDLHRRNGHIVHHLHINFIGIAPLEALENAFQSTLFDFESVAVPHSFDKLAKGTLGSYVRSTLESRHPVGSAPKNTEDIGAYICYLRYYLIQVINETRRQTLAQSQVEILKDETTFELITACGRLLVTVLTGFAIFATMRPEILEERIFVAAFLVSVGGVLGSFLSAVNRIGKMTENQESGRTLSVLSSSLRSIYFVPSIGLAGAWVVFTAVYGGLINGLGPESGFSVSDNLFTYMTGALMLGITAGFSERLVTDVLDRFNKKPSP